MENLFANTGIGKHIIRTHHWGIVLPTLEKAEAFMKTFGLQEDYRGHVKAYDADLIFTKHGNGVDAVEFIIPLSGVLWGIYWNCICIYACNDCISTHALDSDCRYCAIYCVMCISIFK